LTDRPALGILDDPVRRPPRRRFLSRCSMSSRNSISARVSPTSAVRWASSSLSPRPVVPGSRAHPCRSGLTKVDLRCAHL